MQKSHTYNFPEGEILLIDKPRGWTSFDVVNKIRHMLRHYLGIRKIKVGHAGTLDPLATGLLIVCTGKATKQIPGLTGMDKEYTGTFFLGATTPSFDLETEVNQSFDVSHISEPELHKAARGFVGSIQQIPPAYSAVKVDGTRAYRYARSNEKVEIPPRQITIHAFEITDAGMPEPAFRVQCSKGTYIRTLADDFGKALGAGAYLKSLQRTRIGDFDINDAISISAFEEMLTNMQDGNTKGH